MIFAEPNCQVLKYIQIKWHVLVTIPPIELPAIDVSVPLDSFLLQGT